MSDLFDWAKSTRARDDGIDRVTMNESQRWMKEAGDVVRALPPGWEGIGEDIRRLVLDSGLGNPHHPNCWGALIQGMVRAKTLQRTTTLRQMTAVKSHARVSPVLRRA